MSRLASWKGMTVLVTGASSGIGRVLSLRIAREGARVAVVSNQPAELEAVAAEIRGAGGEAHAFECDVSERADAERTCARVLQRLGSVDVLFNNAGYGRHRPFVEWDLGDMDRMMRVNYMGALYFTKLLLPQMVERGKGWIVFTASLAGKIATPGETAYAASKFAVLGFAEALSMEVEASGIHVLTVCPGVIRTPFFDAEAISRLPSVAIKQVVEPATLVDAILKSLKRGRRLLIYPRALGFACIVREVAPNFMRSQVKRSALPALLNPRDPTQARL